MLFLRIIKHLLPRARAWRITVDKTLRQFFQSIADVSQDAKDNFDDVYLDLFPQTTRILDEWEDQFDLRDTGLDEQARRDRLAARWQAVGGQDPTYIQNTLQGAGFDVYVHEWWIPGSEPPVGTLAAATPRNPFSVLFPTSDQSQATIQAGEPLAQAGEPEAQAGNVTSTLGYPLVNVITDNLTGFETQAGDPLSQAGEPDALASGNIVIGGRVVYIIPADPAFWPYFLYIGGEVFGELAAVPQSRRNEFEELCLKICPAQQWLGIIVAYV